MKKIILVSLLLVMGQFLSNAQMTDQQVIDYAKYALSQGRDQKAIAKDLLSSGVTEKQAERIKSSLESGQQSTAASLVDKTLKTRTEDSINRDEFSNTIANEVLPEETTIDKAIFGHNIFNTPNLSFEPNDNAATPQDYRIGPGDELLIEIWGYNEASMSRVVSPEGSISISQVGPVQLSGLTIAEAQKKIKQLLSKKYAGLEDSQSTVSVTLGKIRSIRVSIMGEVRTPGSYRLSSFATVFHALYKANGVTRAGSLRGIKVIRAGKQVAEVDVYGYIFDGKSDSDINLEEGDIIIVPPYKNLVTIEGNVKRPSIYELTENETLQTIIDYSGGFSNAAYLDHIKVIRNNDIEKEIFTVNKEDYSSFQLFDGDVVTIGGTYDRFSNMVEIRGYVYRPDMYQINDEVSTITQLVAKAGGLKEDAFLDRAIILREKDDFSVESISFNIGNVINGSNSDIQVLPNDVIIISGIYELNDRGTLTINGYVNNPGTFVFTDNTTIEDLILRAGGLVQGASLSKVDVARRVVDAKSLTYKDTLAIVISLPISDGFKIEGGDKFILEPNDVVSVRRSPAYRDKVYVDVRGEVNFPGRYLILHQGETITEIIKRAGGLTNQADIDGIRLQRTNNNNNNIYQQINNVVRKNSKRDSVNVSSLTIDNSYLVAIDMREAFKNPNSYADVIMVENDVISIPEIDNTVKVLGEVMFPVAVSYVKNKPVSYYINSAGGFSQNAKRNKAYVVYSNGSAAKTSFGNAPLRPGSIIIVPTKPEPKPMQYGEIAAITTASSSLLSVITLVTSLFKK